MADRQQVSTTDIAPPGHGPSLHNTVRLALVIGALGVVFGDPRGPLPEAS